MTPSKKLKELAKKTGKSLSMKATKKIQILLEERALEILKKSARKSRRNRPLSHYETITLGYRKKGQRATSAFFQKVITVWLMIFKTQISLYDFNRRTQKADQRRGGR